MAPGKSQFNAHDRTVGNDEWLTPPKILAALGPFDLDPCAPVKRPWKMAAKHFTKIDDGLAQEWSGRVWLNPPYGTTLWPWLRRIHQHGNGIALIFNRSETAGFQNDVWPHADAMLFLRGRVKFYDVEGRQAPSSSGAPSVLVAYGNRNVEALERSGLAGYLVKLNGNRTRIG